MVDSTPGELEEARAECDALRSQLNAAQSEAAHAALRRGDALSDAERMDAEVNSLQAEVAYLQQESADLAIGHSTLQAAAAGQVASAIEALQGRYDQLADQFKRVSQEKLEVSKANRGLRAELAAAEQTVAEQRSEIVRCEEQLAECREFVRGVDKRLNEQAVPAKRALEAERAALEVRCGELDSKVAALTGELAALGDEFAGYKRKAAEELERVRSEGELKIAERDQQIAGLKRELGSALQAAEADRAETTATRRLGEHLKAQIKQIKMQAAEEYQAVLEQLRQANRALDTASTRNGELEERCRDLYQDERALQHSLASALEASVGVWSNGGLVGAEDEHFVYHGAFEGIWRRLGGILDAKLPLGKATQHLAPETDELQ